jgi:Bacterial HORMA domain 2
MSTHVGVNTYTYSVTYVTGEMMRSLKLIILLSGLSLDNLRNSWSSVERAINTWLGSRQLQKVTIEIYNPTTNALVTKQRIR